MRIRRVCNASLLTTALVIGLGAVAWAASNMGQIASHEDSVLELAVTAIAQEGVIPRIR